MRFSIKAGEAKPDQATNIASLFFLGALVLAVITIHRYPLVGRGQTLVDIPCTLFDISLIIAGVGAIVVLLEPLLRRRRANWSLQIGVSLWMLFLGPFFLAFSLSALNGLMDTSQPRTYDAALLGWKRTTFKGSVSVIATVRDWRGEQRQQQREVGLWLRGPEQWGVTPDTSIIRVTTKRGFFGYEWYVHLEPLK